MAPTFFLLLLTLFTFASSASLDRRKETLLQDTSDLPLLSRRDDSSFPTPFDTTVGDNFTAPSCTTFFTGLKQASDISACKAISLLIQASKSIVTLTQTLDASCAVDPDRCDSVMNAYALALKSNDNCGRDLAAQNPLTVQAYNGLLAYRSVYNAACLKSTASKSGAKATSSNGSGQYCLATAMTNRSSPSSSYVYQMPLGRRLPADALPTCNQCLADTMQGYAAQAGNATQPLSRVFGDAVAQVDTLCGPDFVKATVPTVSGAALGARVDAASRMLLAVLAATVVWLVA